MITLQEFDDIIARVEAAYGYPATIAGGAVRDYLLGIEPKDVDVFVLCGDNWIPTTPTPQGFTVDNTPSLREEEDIHYTYNGSHISDVENFWYDGRKIQIIIALLDNGYKLLKTFDWNICKFGYHPSVGIVQDVPIESITELVVYENPRDPKKSLERGWDFSRRYYVPISEESLSKLLALTVEVPLAEIAL